MIKIAIEIKEKCKEEIINGLKKKNYNVDMNSFMTTWVYDLGNIHYGKDSIILENGTMFSYEIKLKDLDYFEIHSQKEV